MKNLRENLLSDFYQSTIIEVAVYFGFSGFHCRPEDISIALRIQPDEALLKGTKRTGPWGRIVEDRWNSWSISSRCASKDVNDHLRDLLQRLQGKAPAIREEFGTPSFSVLWKGNYLYSGSGPFYEADVIRGIADLRAELWQDIYQVDQLDDEVDWKGPFRRVPNDH